MSDLDTLIVAFQTQLSDVMETVVRTAMYEVTRLVEEGLLEEVRRRSLEAKALRTQLQWTERRLLDQVGKDGKRTSRCVKCDKNRGEMPPGVAEESPPDMKDGIIMECNVKKEADSVEIWTQMCVQENISESEKSSDEPKAALSAEPERQMEEQVNGKLAHNVKEEDDQLSCSAVCLRQWCSSSERESASESQNCSEMSEAQPKQNQENGEDVTRMPVKNTEHSRTQSTLTHACHEDLKEMPVFADPAHASPPNVDANLVCLSPTRVGILHNRLGLDKDCDKPNPKDSLKGAERERTDPVKEVQAFESGDRMSSTESLVSKVLKANMLTVAIKQEVTMDPDDNRVKETLSRSGMASLTCSAKQHGFTTHKPNRLSYKAPVHSKVSASLRLQAAVQHLHRSMKKPLQSPSKSTLAMPPSVHPHTANFNPLNRIPPASKVVPVSSLASHRDHLHDKPASSPARTSASWVSIKALHQSPNSQQPHSQLSPESRPQQGAKSLLRCGHCDRCFPHPSNLKAHLQTHTGERPFSCSLCGRSFTKLSNLKAHRRVHTGERPYSCSACGKRFTQKCNLKRHQRIHVDG